jgi:hypothetical protein
VALLQDRTATNQANLLPRPMKCFLNKFWEEAPTCSTLTQAEIITTYSCNCNDSWVPEVLTFNDFSYVSFRPAEYIVSAGANIYMTLQAFFNCEDPINPFPSHAQRLMGAQIIHRTLTLVTSFPTQFCGSWCMTQSSHGKRLTVVATDRSIFTMRMV